VKLKIRELRVDNKSAWITPAKDYWDTEIHNKCISEGWLNENEMKTNAHNYIDALQTAYTLYKNGGNVESLKRALLVIYGYISTKYGMTVSGSPPEISEIVSGDDIRNFYVNWLNDLPDYEDIFTLNPLESKKPKPITKGVVNKTESYTNCESTITGGNSSDSARLVATETEISGKVRPFMVYLLYSKPTTTPTGINVKTFALQNMFLQNVLDEFGFTIAGIND